jgi:fucose 4-O-acetylase-like acetyltransferase
MISGYFLPQSFDRKGRSFLGDRFSRLGIPLLVFFFVVIPVMMYAYHVSFRPYGPIPFISYYFHFYFNHGVRPIGSVLLGRMRTLGICGSSNICSSSPSAIGCGD